MPEIKKFWYVRDMLKLEYLFEDPVLKTDEDRMEQLMGDAEGMSIHRLVRIYVGTGQDVWERENTKVYDNLADARRDAAARVKKAWTQYKKQQGKKSHLLERVVERHLGR